MKSKERPKKFEENSTINLFLVGVGLIGKTLLEQIQEKNLNIRVCGLANRTSMLTDLEGITLSDWTRKLTKGQSSDIQKFVRQMIEMKAQGSVFVDCTAGEDVPLLYGDILSAGIPIVTPNKKAASGTQDNYEKLKRIAVGHHAPFVYETNVGAGLPMIRTIARLVHSGDEILEIEAVLSGTHSYLWSAFLDGDKPFSEIVRDAQMKGYTEPDPRDDLSGMDVARKMLILARESGLKREIGDVHIVPLLSNECMEAKSMTEFYTILKKSDKDFERRKINAMKNNKVLRFIARLHKGKLDVSLQEVGKEHQAFGLSSGEQILILTTKRPGAEAIIVRGPGAGADVTVRGILANIKDIYQ